MAMFGTRLGLLATGGGRYIVCGDAGYIAYSVGGVTWTEVNTGAGTNFTAVAFGNGVWVVVGETNTMYRSTNGGVTWSMASGKLGTAGNWQAISYAAGLFFALDDGGRIATSPDGITWTQRTSPFSGATSAGATYGAAGKLYLASGSLAASSNDGITWTSINTGLSERAVASNGSITALYDSEQVSTSTDGTSWSGANNLTQFGTQGGVKYTGGFWFRYGTRASSVAAVQYALTPTATYVNESVGAGATTGVASNGLGQFIAVDSQGEIHRATGSLTFTQTHTGSQQWRDVQHSTEVYS